MDHFQNDFTESGCFVYSRWFLVRFKIIWTGHPIQNGSEVGWTIGLRSTRHTSDGHLTDPDSTFSIFGTENKRLIVYKKRRVRFCAISTDAFDNLKAICG